MHVLCTSSCGLSWSANFCSAEQSHLDDGLPINTLTISETVAGGRHEDFVDEDDAHRRAHIAEPGEPIGQQLCPPLLRGCHAAEAAAAAAAPDGAGAAARRRRQLV